MCSENAIRVEALSKCYPIYARPGDRLKQFVLPRLQQGLGWQQKRYFREFWALQEVSFEVARGETVGIIGRNGSGKSTLLQIICGTLQPSGGRIEVNGRVAALLELGSGFNPEFTGRENVYLNAAVLGLSKAEVDQRFEAIAAFADIGTFIEQPVKMYSSGMMVRLAFAVIAHVDADILVIDEALAVGDAFFTQKCMRFLRRFMETGTVLFVSHDTGAVINLCQRAIWLDRGRTRFQGAPKEAAQLYLAELFEARQGETTLESSEREARSTDPDRADDDQAGGRVAKAQARLQPPRDMRLDFINATVYRNDIEVFSFNPDAAQFGQGGGQVTEVRLLDEAGQPLAWVVGGERVILEIDCRAQKALFSPIVGFYLLDRLGQALFGDNTARFSQRPPLSIAAGEAFMAAFTFQMPFLPMGDYAVTVALAEGTNDDHVQHHWLHDALIVKSHCSSGFGLIGIPMEHIELVPR
ncbi:ABC transporter ATP-binding protein [Halochromatium salexigens]|uniref:ABC transporter ATP-binding protein n=1 Tax=Halochromatium salexigens TaxID=49447 RepID=A0AAJ0UEE9_HALSE|nr:ABC transporter ATP-binding protein [Halochromatium salexigens]MBK5929405.1 ABC transporter ATP-binding protein [Halochromatium salexigens]